MESNLTLGSLFDGSGGFPLGGMLAGITPVWAAEIEPFPIRVTTKRMPLIRHYGNVCEMDGGKIEPVDIVTFGSPCQDMSVAGKRSGLDGSRSCLFYEAVRIIKEMRCATDGKYPRYAVWENVPGAFSSNGGEDFRSVVEALCEVKDEGVSVPRPERWPSAGEVLGDGFSVAWRVLDAQYWGVPQRRKRIYLVADFAGQSAGKILFESEGVSGYSAEGFHAWQGAARDAAGGLGEPSDDGGLAFHINQRNEVIDLHGVSGALMATRNMQMQTFLASTCETAPNAAGFCTEHSARSRSIGYEEGKSPTLRTGTVPAAVFENHSQDTRYTGPLEAAPTVSSTYGTGGNNQPFVVGETPKTLKIRSGCEGGGKGALVQEDKSATLGCNNDQTVFVPFAKGTRPHSADEAPTWKEGEVANTLNTHDVGEWRCNELAVAYGIGAYSSKGMLSGNPHAGTHETETARTLDVSGTRPTCNQGGTAIVESYAIQGNMIGRDDKNGPQGSGVNKDVSFTLNATDRHAVYAMSTGGFMQTGEEVSPTLEARDYKDPNTVAYGIGRDAFNQGKNAQYALAIEEELQPTMVAKGPGAVKSGYAVRRLTPTECARLQGFPDWWCAELGTEEPTEDELSFWQEVFDTYRKSTNPDAKPKSPKQVAKWLRDPYSDAAEYKMWGNGVALPCVFFVLAGIAHYGTPQEKLPQK